MKCANSKCDGEQNSPSGKMPIINQGSPESGGMLSAPLAGSVMRFAGIDWRVLAVENNKALLLSEKVLEHRPYDTELVDITWENCTLRQYLNDDFYNKLGAEKSAIAETHNANPNNLWYGTNGGSATTDKIFLLSLEEADKYFGNSGDYINKRRKGSSGKTESSGYRIDTACNKDRMASYGSKKAWWWLRSPGYSSSRAADVGNGGRVDVYGSGVLTALGGVRPALWLNL